MRCIYARHRRPMHTDSACMLPKSRKLISGVVGADYYLGKDWVDLDDPSVTKDHVRKWRVLQDLKVRFIDK